MCFVAGTVSLCRRGVLPSPCEVALGDPGELRTGPLPPRPANKRATWPKLTSGDQKARCLICPLIYMEMNREQRRDPRGAPQFCRTFQCSESWETVIEGEASI